MLHELVEDLAKAAVLTDATDLMGLVALQERFQTLREETEGQCELLTDVAERATGLVEDIVLRQAKDPEGSFKLVAECIEFTQSVVEALQSGTEIDDSFRSPFDAHEDASGGGEELDESLLIEWLADCRETLGGLEADLVAIDSGDESEFENLVAEVRRKVHTFKGECGILSLPVAQKLCHESESAIDRTIESKSEFPVDPMLALVDWIKRYADALAGDVRATPPDHEQLLETIIGIVAEDGTEAGVTTGARSTDAGSTATNTTTTGDSEAADRDQPVEFPCDPGMDETLNDFLCEAREHLESAEQALLELEGDFGNTEVINTVFRAFHTIKGVAGFLNLAPIVELAHTAETLLDGARSGTITLDSSYLDVILNASDLMGQMVEALEGGTAPTKGELSDMVALLRDANEGKAPPPPPTSRDKPSLPLGRILIDMGICDAESVQEALDSQKEGATALCDLLRNAGLDHAEVVENELTAGSGQGRTIREMILDLGVIEAKELDRAITAQRESGNRLGELLCLDNQTLAPALKEQRRQRRENDATPPAAAPATPTPPKAAETPQGGRSQLQKRVDQTVKVNTTRMDALVDMVGELVIAQQMIMQDPEIQELHDSRVQKNMGRAGKIVRDLQEVAMSLRMVTVKGTFQKMARLVRDISSKSGKKIQFNIEGEDTELDRNVVEEIGDPLVHMIRNSCDHGIELAEDRVAAGKSPVGNLTLRAYHQGGSIVIEVADDGKGLDRERILAKAIERGLIAADRDPQEIPDSEIHSLIFSAGFSTAKQVTDISGRGVGMDVVRRNIDALRGKVEIRSKPGQGTVFLMRLPLTMAIIDGMVVRVGNDRYVVPTLSIENSYRPTPDQLHSVTGKGEMASARGSLLPIHRLKKVLRLKDGHDNIDDGLLIVVESSAGSSCLFVDEIIGQQQVVIKTLGTTAQNIRGVSGGAILGDGRVALILDIDGLVSEATEQTAA